MLEFSKNIIDVFLLVEVFCQFIKNLTLILYKLTSTKNEKREIINNRVRMLEIPSSLSIQTAKYKLYLF